MFGYQGQRLRVDLTNSQFSVEEISPAYRKKWLGGRGFNSELLYREVGPEVKPLHPENRLIFGVGPLTGTFSPGSGRTTVTAKSPLTYPEAHGDANMGGHFGPELKYAGYDQLVIQGKADHPVYLFIDDGRVEIKDARHLWGCLVREADQMIRCELGDPDVQIALIGPAGENLVRYACVMTSVYRAAGRCGMGAVMGSKNLKAVVVRGNKPVKIADPQAFERVCGQLRDKLSQDMMVKMLYDIGTNLLIRPAAYEQGWFPWKNFQAGTHPNADNLSGEIHKRTFLKHREGCFGCSISCGRFSQINKGKYQGTETGGPEYETYTALGSRIGIINADAALYNNKLVNDYGLDSLSTGGTLGWAMECYQRGLLKEADTGGIALQWGDQEVIEKLIKMIAYREGFGDLLAEGAFRVAQKLGRGKEFTNTIKGVELPSDDPRGIGYAFGLGFGVSTRGADHLRGLPCLELTGQLYPGLMKSILGTDEAKERLTTTKKPEMLKWHEELKAVGDCMTQCTFNHAWSFAILIEDMTLLLNTATGMHFSTEELLQVGERIINLERAHWGRLLSGKNEDYLPPRFINEPMPGGPSNGSTVPFGEMLPRYYEVRGWDLKTGYPLSDKLEELGLNEVDAELVEYRIAYEQKMA